MDRDNVLLDGLIDGGTVKDLSREPAYQTPNPNPGERGNLFRWSLSIGLMVVLHGFWWFWLSLHVREPAAPPPRGPQLRILVGASGQRIWTPTVLALPTEIGFSGSAMTNEIGEGPSIRMPRGPVSFLERDAYHAVARDGDEVWTSPPLVVRTPPPPALVEDVPPLFPEDGFQVQFDGRRLDAPGPEFDSTAAGDEAWSLTAWVEFDDQGQVVHAMIEQSTQVPAVDQAVLRGLYRWRPQPGLDVPVGSVTIGYVPEGEAIP